MAPLAAYPGRPAEGESGWYNKRENYDETVESNISEAHSVATSAQSAAEGSVQPDNLRLPIPLTQTEFDALNPKVPGQVYFVTGT